MFLEDYGCWLTVIDIDNTLLQQAMHLQIPYFLNLETDFIVGIKYFGQSICYISLPSIIKKEGDPNLPFSEKINVYLPEIFFSEESLRIQIDEQDILKPVQNIFLKKEILNAIKNYIKYNGLKRADFLKIKDCLLRGSCVPK